MCFREHSILDLLANLGYRGSHSEKTAAMTLIVNI